jgi:microcin C transport system permease protein
MPFRNSFIPIASSLGQLITLIVTGSLLIETVFDIQGFGLLQFRAITAPDQMLIMGTLTVASFLMVMGNISLGCYSRFRGSSCKISLKP